MSYSVNNPYLDLYAINDSSYVCKNSSSHIVKALYPFPQSYRTFHSAPLIVNSAPSIITLNTILEFVRGGMGAIAMFYCYSYSTTAVGDDVTTTAAAFTNGAL